MDSRQQFEDWYFKRFGEKDLKVVKPHAEFCDAWEIWQASRNAIEIDLPDITEKRWTSWAGFRVEAFWIHIRREIKSHGLKVKSNL